MENKIIDGLEQLNMEQTDMLLEDNYKFDIDSQTLKRIKASVYKRTGLKRKMSMGRKAFAAAAAALVILTVSTLLIGVDNVADAFAKLFGFIPGYGIVENNTAIKYIGESNETTTENNQIKFNIKSILATKDNISVSFEIEKKNYDESKAAEEKKNELERLEKSGLKSPDITIAALGKVYKASGSSTGGGGKTETTSVNFKLPEEAVNTDTTYALDYRDYSVSMTFKLKRYDSYDSLEEIGPTATHNNISITAIAKKNDKKLEIELYTVNKSKYDIYSYTREYDKGYQGKDLSLVTSTGRHAYTTPGSSMGPNNKFYFDVAEQDKKPVLNIPFIIAESKENKVVSIDIPKAGKKLALDKEVAFEDSTMIITEVERIDSQENPYGVLRIKFSYKNNKPDVIFKNAQFMRANFLGVAQSGGYSTTLDENEITSAIEFYLEKGENDKLRLKIDRPQYYLLDEYNLEINN